MGPAAGDASAPVEPDPLDEALVRARRGDERSFELLWEALHPPLVRYLQVIGPPSQADDLASETWAQVVRDLHRFDGDARAFRAWLYTVGRHRLLDASRYRHRLRRTPGREPAPAVAPSAEEAADAGWSLRDALALLGGLPRRQAEAVALRVVAGLDTAEAARVAGTTPGALRVNLHRGLQTLASDPRLSALREYA